MSRQNRWIPEEGALVEVTCRTVHSRLLLSPRPEVCEVVLGVLAQAQELYPVECCGVAFLSNHYHMLLTVPDAKRLADFVGYVNSNIAREVGRLVDWKEKFWSRRYQAIVVSQEEEVQVGRLRYILAHGCKEGLVEKAREWPGVHCVRALADGESLQGYWFDRTQEGIARRRGEQIDRLQFATEKELELSPLPCWRHLDPQEVRRRVSALVEEIEREAAVERRKNKVQVFGAKKILSQKPHSRLERTKKSPAPLFHAATKAARKALWEAYALFLAAFREASEKLRQGDRHACFPLGSFPPGLPFVGLEAVAAPS